MRGGGEINYYEHDSDAYNVLVVWQRNMLFLYQYIIRIFSL